MGQARFDLKPDGTTETDLSLSRECRDRGLGAEALRLDCEMLGASGKGPRVVAGIKSENVAH